MYGRARRRAAGVLSDVAASFAILGYRAERAGDDMSATLSAPGRPDLRVRLVPVGRVFGGAFALEIATRRPVLPPTAGLAARGRGIVRWHGISFRPKRRDDDAARALARRLETDGRLADALAAVHFEQVRVEPDGRPVIRHMGGSLVWLLFPPVARTVPLVPEQIRATATAIDAFVDVATQPAE